MIGEDPETGRPHHLEKKGLSSIPLCGAVHLLIGRPKCSVIGVMHRTLPGNDLVLQRQKEVVRGELVSRTAAGRGPMQREDDEADHVT